MEGQSCVSVEGGTRRAGESWARRKGKITPHFCPVCVCNSVSATQKAC